MGGINLSDAIILYTTNFFFGGGHLKNWDG